MKVIEIEHAGHSIGVVPDCGGGLAWFRSCISDTSATWSWLREATVGSRIDPLDLACFPLAPFSNRIADAQFGFAGDHVALSANFPPEPHAIHGVAWQAAWQIERQTSSEITLGLDWRGGDWPWKFEAQIVYGLSDTGLHCLLRLLNQDTRAMPSGLGWHPYFTRTDDVTLQAPARGLVINDNYMLPCAVDWHDPVLSSLTNGKPLPIGFDNELVGWSGAATIRWPELKHGLEVRSEPRTSWAVLFTPADEGYFCFEPVTHLTNAHNSNIAGIGDTGLIEIAPGETHRLTMSLAPIVE